MALATKRLSTGYWRIQGDGPCEWAQPRDWPCAPREIEASIFPEASEKFRLELRRENQQLLDGEGK